VSLISPVNGFSYQKGAQVIANYSCLDALSGMASCTGPIASGQLLPLDTPGTYSFDVAGNQTQVTRSYTVK
jgi:hypothetical protein